MIECFSDDLHGAILVLNVEMYRSGYWSYSCASKPPPSRLSKWSDRLTSHAYNLFWSTQTIGQITLPQLVTQHKSTYSRAPQLSSAFLGKRIRLADLGKLLERPVTHSRNRWKWMSTAQSIWASYPKRFRSRSHESPVLPLMNFGSCVVDLCANF